MIRRRMRSMTTARNLMTTTTRRAALARNVRLEPLEDRAMLTAYVVDTPNDVVGNDGVISLREAVEAASTNAASGDAPAGMADGDTITFDNSLDGVPIVLTMGELSITDDLLINGQLLDITVDAGGASRIFNINTDETVGLANLTLTGGAVADEGGAVAVAGGGQTNMRHVTILDSTASGDGGGAIFNDASTVRIWGSLISGNTADGASGSGGGILNGPGGILQVFHSEISKNTAASEGGGLWNGTGNMTVVLTRIHGNSASGDAADDGGGGIFNDGGTLLVNWSSITENTADGDAGSGGGIFANGGDVHVLTSQIDGNSANRAGGGLEVVAANVDIAFSRLSQNVAGPDGSAAPGNGGGLHVTGADSQVRVLGSHVTGNTAASEGGGLWNDAGSTLSVIASTIARNQALGTAPDNGGGGIFNNGGVLDILFSEISRNSATANGGGLFLGEGGDVSIVASRVSQNEAGANGGGIYNNAELLVQFSSVTRNTAADGGGIYTDTLGVTDLAFALLFGNNPNNLAGPGMVI
jgi:hypothetical protein